MQSTAKANALVRDLADKLKKRYEYANPPASAGLNTVRLAFDAAGWPMILISNNANEASGAPVLAIRIRNVDMQSKDVFGGQTFAYAPHVLEIGYELAPIFGSLPAPADLMMALYESIKTGVRLQLKEIANGTAVSETALDAAVPALSDLEELYWPTKSV